MRRKAGRERLGKNGVKTETGANNNVNITEKEFTGDKNRDKKRALQKVLIKENKMSVQSGAVKCDKCNNTGNCPHCEGQGLVGLKQKPCKYCQGSGTCPTCNGQGWILVPAVEQL